MCFVRHCGRSKVELPHEFSISVLIYGQINSLLAVRFHDKLFKMHGLDILKHKASNYHETQCNFPLFVNHKLTCKKCL